ncbi:MAG: TetR/AcrR family transcriptional regulator [Proteobacteria bacterium]|nr:TetR/AcrR family transcriptional regulator [Pseudomonadota bacterium]MBS0550523.1 TetR/AcrR family transcriptional regulator [Pseudomonadota bacterium]
MQPVPAGRGDRVARTREAIVSSTLSLAQGGEVAPIVRDIAKLAGVSARTVFQHFADTAELYVAVLGRTLTTLTGEAPQVNRQWPLDKRIGVAVDHRAERYEGVRPMWTFLQTLQRRSAEAAAKIVQLYSGNREQISDTFGPELSALSQDKRERTLNALSVALTPESWIVLRERLGLTVEQAREEWRFIVKSIFSDNP